MSSPDEVVLIRLNAVFDLLDEAKDVAGSVDGTRVHMGNNALKADTKRDMLYLADVLDRAAVETRAVYHTLNGQPDVLARRRA